MANQILSPAQFAKDALEALFSHYKIGDTIHVRKPPRYVAAEQQGRKAGICNTYGHTLYQVSGSRFSRDDVGSLIRVGGVNTSISNIIGPRVVTVALDFGVRTDVTFEFDFSPVHQWRVHEPRILALREARGRWERRLSLMRTPVNTTSSLNIDWSA